MAKIILGMTISLDGFINDRNGSASALYPDLKELRNTELLQEAIADTGAVVMGRKSYAMGDPDQYADNYEFQVPIFVVTHNPPVKKPKETKKLTFTFVTDSVESAVAQAKAAARDKNVTIIGGASIFKPCLRTKLVDELHIDIMPILLGEGQRLFEDIGTQVTQLEKIKVVESIGGRTHLRFRVVK